MKSIQYILLILIVCVALLEKVYIIQAQSTNSPPEYIPSNFDLLYVHDGVHVQKETIQTAKNKMYADQKDNAYDLKGYASYYAEKFHNRITANGERFNMNALTAAHKSLPFDSIVKVTNKATNHSVIVRINDRGPYIENRIIDLSKKAAEEIGMIASGVASVEIEIISLGEIEKDSSNVLTSSHDYFNDENDRVSIQVASYSKQNNAQRLINRLYEYNVYAIIEQHGGYYRVIVSDLNKEEYFTASNTLKELGFAKTIVRTH